MNTRNSINIILILFVAALVAILVFDKDQVTQVSYNLSSITQKNITSIEITRQTAKPLKFKKENNRWLMTVPFQVPANAFFIESLLRITEATSTTQFTISNNDKNKFKLNPPRATLKLNKQLFLFGTNEQLNLNRYIFTNDKLFLIPDRFFYLLNSAATGFIDHALIGKDEIITGLKLANYNIQLRKSNWEIKPAPTRISTDDIVQLISEWNNSQAVNISKINEVKSSEKNFSIEVSLKNKSKPVRFDIFINDEFYLFVRQEKKLQYKLNHDMAKRLLNFPNTQKNELTSKPNKQK